MTQNPDFIDTIHFDLSSLLDTATADYFIAESARFAQLALDEQSHDESITMTEIDDMLAEYIEPACTFSPLPASIADFDELALLAYADTLFTLITHYFIINPDALNSPILARIAESDPH